jgi:hypothetical protein
MPVVVLSAENFLLNVVSNSYLYALNCDDTCCIWDMKNLKCVWDQVNLRPLMMRISPSHTLSQFIHNVVVSENGPWFQIEDAKWYGFNLSTKQWFIVGETNEERNENINSLQFKLKEDESVLAYISKVLSSSLGIRNTLSLSYIEVRTKIFG